MNKIICFLLCVLSATSFSQPVAEKPKILYGTCTKDSLLTESFSKWFTTGYDGYIPTTAILNALKKQNTNGITVKVFFGTWCGDSRREVPRFLKILSAISFPEKNIQLIALGGSDSLYKQSPGKEEVGLGIFRVPIFVFYKNGIEINRINEFPVYSMEKDMLTILSAEQYQPNYKFFSTIIKWLKNETLTDENSNTRGLAEQLRPLVSSEHELNSLGYLLLKQDKKKEALRIFQINYTLYPESANVASSLGEGYFEIKEYSKAITYLEYSLELNKDSKAIKEILELLYKVKEKQRG
jgi:tetratricopeptide (TPR) repeat protein